jgi:hypothetical protein
MLRHKNKKQQRKNKEKKMLLAKFLLMTARFFTDVIFFEDLSFFYTLFICLFPSFFLSLFSLSLFLNFFFFFFLLTTTKPSPLYLRISMNIDKTKPIATLIKYDTSLLLYTLFKKSTYKNLFRNYCVPCTCSLIIQGDKHAILLAN